MSLGTNSDIRNGHWLGEVVDNKDPLKNGRCRVRIFGKFDSLPNDSIPWSSAGNRSAVGQHTVPNIGEIVEVTFDNGNIYSPVYGEIVNQNKNLKDKVISKDE